jgi:PKD repeat protein
MCFVAPVLAIPCAVLKVSLPDGFYHGYDVDPWLSESYILNLTGASQTFTVRINNTSSSIRSYDTRLVIALNDMGYNNLVSLVVNGTSVPKSAFKWGTPKPYNKWTWPSGDVYPTWFNDTVINVGYIPKKGYKTLVVSVTFSDAAGVRMHFDAYGKTTSESVTWDGQIVHNPLSQDSSVLLYEAVGPPPPQPPVAIFSYTPIYPEVNQAVTFDASDSYDPDGDIVSYTWDFGDGSPVVVESDPITYHTYTSYGDYNVTLTVTDNSSLTAVETAKIHISQHPVAAFTFSPQDPLIHELVTFDASTSTPDGGTIVSYTWDFGDGNITSTSNPIITHAYNNYGTYTVTLNVTDSEGKWDTESQQITVENAPVADFWWTPYYPQRGETVTFDASASTPDGGTIISYAWDFGDGTPIVEESDPTTTHVYTEAGNYLVTLNVTDSEGRWDTEAHVITVVPKRYYLTVKTDPQGVTAIPGENWYSEGAEVQLTAPDMVPVSAGVRYKFTFWDVDGTQVAGNPITVVMNAPHTATAHYTVQAITYTLKIEATAGGTTSPAPGTYTYAQGSIVQVTANPSSGYVFDHWELNGTNVGTATTYTVTMNANYVLKAFFKAAPTPPTVSINPMTASIMVGQQVTFMSTVSGGTQPYHYQWYLNGNPVSGAISESWAFTPTATGTYYVVLKVTDDAGNIGQSEPAKVTVSAVPVGGYSVSLAKSASITPIIAYTLLMVLFGSLLSMAKRKRK